MTQNSQINNISREETKVYGFKSLEQSAVCYAIALRSLIRIWTTEKNGSVIIRNGKMKVYD
jgi:hypothetical protein